MSNAKNTQTEKAAATETPVKKDGPMVYCGPTVKNTVKQYTVYHDSKAVPDAVNRFLDAVPMARGLLVPLDKFKDTRVALENPKSSAGILFAAVKAALNEGGREHGIQAWRLCCRAGNQYRGTRDGNCWPAGRYRHCADQPRK